MCVSVERRGSEDQGGGGVIWCRGVMSGGGTTQYCVNHSILSHTSSEPPSLHTLTHTHTTSS